MTTPKTTAAMTVEEFNDKSYTTNADGDMSCNVCGTFKCVCSYCNCEAHDNWCVVPSQVAAYAALVEQLDAAHRALRQLLAITIRPDDISGAAMYDEATAALQRHKGEE